MGKPMTPWFAPVSRIIHHDDYFTYKSEISVGWVKGSKVGVWRFGGFNLKLSVM